MTGLKSPKAGMHPRQGRIQRHNFQTAEGLLHPPPTLPYPSCIGLDMNAKPEFRRRDGADRDGFGCTRVEPGCEAELLAFVGNEQRTVENQPHGFLSGLRALRPFWMAAENERRSSALSSTPAMSSANSWVVLPRSTGGTK